MKMGIRVYDVYSKYGKLPDYQADPSRCADVYKNVPIFVVSAHELDAAIRLKDVEVIRKNCKRPLVLTDRKRVLMVNPEGYSYARYVCVIDVETARAILSWV